MQWCQGAVKFQFKLQTSFTVLNFILINDEKVVCVRMLKLRLPRAHCTRQNYPLFVRGMRSLSICRIIKMNSIQHLRRAKLCSGFHESIRIKRRRKRRDSRVTASNESAKLHQKHTTYAQRGCNHAHLYSRRRLFHAWKYASCWCRVFLFLFLLYVNNFNVCVCAVRLADLMCRGMREKAAFLLFYGMTHACRFPLEKKISTQREEICVECWSVLAR